MNWKRELQLRDIADDQPIEVVCKLCGHGRREWPAELRQIEDYGYLYLDELEQRLKCLRWGCPGEVRVSLSKPGETEAFIGGMA